MGKVASLVPEKTPKEKKRQDNIVSAVLDDFQKQPKSVQDEVLVELSRAHSHGVGSFFCNNIGCMITVPCTASACHYHVSTGKASHNCILKAKFDQGNDTLSVDAISDLTNIPESRIRASIEKAFNRVRAHTLLSEINANKYNRFTYYSNVGVCIVCGGLTPKRPFVVDKESGLSYCSRACYKKKPPSLIKLEVFYAADIRIILSVARKLLKRLPLIASTLDVKRRLLLKWYEAFLGITPNVFGTDAVDFVDIMKRSQPKHSWSLDFLSSVYNRTGPGVNQKMLDLETDCKKLCRDL